jgi:hypothetical protein
LQPQATNVQVAKVLGVHESTVRADTSGNPEGQNKKPKKSKGLKTDASGNPAPSLLSGAAAAKFVESKETKGERKAALLPRPR